MYCLVPDPMDNSGRVIFHEDPFRSKLLSRPDHARPDGMEFRTEDKQVVKIRAPCSQQSDIRILDNKACTIFAIPDATVKVILTNSEGRSS